MKPIFTFLIFTLLLAACGPVGAAQAPAETSLTIMAAGSLTEAFTEIGAAFRAENPDIKPEFNFAGSQVLAQQIAQGAPVDVFASANERQMGAAVETGRVSRGDLRVFARNRLVAILPVENPAGLGSLRDLANPNLKIVLAGEEVPVGQYSLEFLASASRSPDFGEAYRENVLANVVSYEDNVKAVLAKVALGEADAGIVYSSDIGAAAADVTRVEIPDEYNVVATYPIAALNDSPNLAAAEAFIEFVLSAEGQAILVKYGFIPLEE